MQFSMDMLLPIGLIVIFFFMIIMPQRKRDKQVKEMLSALAVGNKIVTIGGICGKIVKLNDDNIVIETGPNKTTMQFERSAIRNVIDADAATAKDDAEQKAVDAAAEAQETSTEE